MQIKLFIAALFLIVIASCGNTGNPNKLGENTHTEKTNKTDYLEVICFHGTRQCITCKNMKAYTLKALQNQFAQQLTDSSIVFKIIDVDLPENAAIAEKFEATGTALMFNKVVNGKDSIIDLSDFAFEHAEDESKYIPKFNALVQTVISQK